MEVLTDDQKIRKVIERVWSDPSFKSRLKESPAEVLKEYGIETSPEHKLQVIESTSDHRYFVLPPSPESSLTADEVIAKSNASDYKVLVHVLYDVNCC